MKFPATALLSHGAIFGKFPILQQPIGLPRDFSDDEVMSIKLDPAYRQKNFDNKNFVLNEQIYVFSNTFYS